MRKTEYTFDVVVCGGGLAGFCAAVAAARLGQKTCIVQNRPVFGGNSSSEIGVTPHGTAAFHGYARETGIISELLIEERAKNHAEIYENGWTNSVWDLTMYNMAENIENLTCFMNTNVDEVIRDLSGRNIQAIAGTVINAELSLIIYGQLFIDCTGDGIVADRAGCRWRMGSEAKSEFNEPHAPENASNDTMGNSIHFRTKNMGYPVPFTAPDWAIKHENPAFFYEQGRLPKDERGGFWWLEIGVPFHTIYDNETIRHELTRHALGVWDWMKNKDPGMMERCKNYALDWIGQVPGKRESRRIMGEYFITEHDILDKTIFEDEIAFGGWFVDLHTPGGVLASSSEPTNHHNYDTFNDYAVKSYCGPYGVPLRACIAKDVDNLMMAGRNISTTHAALGTLRVMGTTALMGQACGVAAAIALRKNIPVKYIPKEAIFEVKQQLLRDGCFLPNNKNEDPDDLALSASVTASSEAFVFGVGPESKGFHQGMNSWKDQPQYKSESMTVRKGQMIAVNDRIDWVSVCLSNTSGKTQHIEAFVYNADHIWDYRREPSAPLASSILKVPVGENIWVKWDLNLSQEKGLNRNGYIRIDLNANPEIGWKIAGCILPGHLSVYQIGNEKMRRFSDGVTLSFQISPPQPAFSAKNVISGVTRPHKSTNLWRSDPNMPLEQWIQLSWQKEQLTGMVELTLAGNLLREYHAYGPFYLDPQCARDLRIDALLNGQWETVASIKGNYQRLLKLNFNKPVKTTDIRVVVEKTNGDPSAMIYEVRCYAGDRNISDEKINTNYLIK